MTVVGDVLAVLEQIAPSRLALSFDKIGQQVGSADAPVIKAVVSLDRSLGAVRYARSIGADLLLAHHPLLFSPLASVNPHDHVGRTVIELIEGGISFVAAHTNWDCARGGVNDALLAALGITDGVPFGMANPSTARRVVVFAPFESAGAVIDAASAAGAGQIGLYSRCAFFSPGTGTFLGGEGSSPVVGKAGQIEEVEEVRIEMVCPADRQSAVERAIRASHPYEEPALDFLATAGGFEHPAGRTGELSRAMSFGDFAALVDSKLDTRSWAWGSGEVRRVAVVGGAADGDWAAARAAGADVFVTGEVRQHIALEAGEMGMGIIAAGHYATEQPGVVALAEAMSQRLPSVGWFVFRPEPGQSGRPMA